MSGCHNCVSRSATEEPSVTQKSIQTEFKGGAKKEVMHKLRMDLIPPEMIEGLAAVLTYGTTKYGDRNWEQGIPFMTSYAAAMRHLVQFAKHNDIDRESGLIHLEQAACNLLMIATQIRRARTDLDDRSNIK